MVASFLVYEKDRAADAEESKKFAIRRELQNK